MQQLVSAEGEDGDGFHRDRQAGGQQSEKPEAVQRRLRNTQSHRQGRLRRGEKFPRQNTI